MRYDIYIAASLLDIETAREMSRHLSATWNQNIVSSWHTRPVYKKDNHSVLTAIGARNIQDLQKANMLICLLNHPSSGGGRHFEHGYASAKNIPTILIGPNNENVFQLAGYHTHVTSLDIFYGDVAELLFS